MRSVLQTFLIFLLFIPITGFSQTGKIAGTVKDSRTGETLMGVNVVVEDTKLGAASNTDGYYAVLNVPPGTYTVKASLIGYNSTSTTNVKVYIDQTTELNLQLTETSITTSEVVVTAQAPVIQKDVSSSSVNLDNRTIENLPTVSITTVVGLQAGISGTTIRGGGGDQTNYLLNGVSLKDERTNVPYTVGLSTTNIEAVQVLTGGFNAEYGNIRSGLVNIVTKEGSTDRFTVNFVGRYRPAAPKHFGMSPQDPNAFWMRPFVDDQVAWTGTAKGWDAFTQAQYPDFIGWNAVSAQMFRDNPSTALTPQELQKLWLFQHRRNTEIKSPDYDVDLSIGGYLPYISKQLGNLRFMVSYKTTRSMYIVPLSRDSYRTGNFQLRLTSDVGQGMKLNLEGMIGNEFGTTTSGDGTVSVTSGMFTTPYGIAAALSNFSQFKTIENRLFTDDYFSPASSFTNNVGVKFTHALSANTFYEVTVSRMSRHWETGPGRYRDTSKVYLFGNNYRVDEGPFGFWEFPSTGLENFRMSVGFSNGRDSSKYNSFNAKFDFTSQLDKFNQVKTGLEFNYTENLANYASVDRYLPSGRYRTSWNAYPIRASIYAQDKLEFEGMIANLGVRVDYSAANTKWYNVTDPYSSAFSSANSLGIDTLLTVSPTKANVTVSPRLGIAFPITESSKLFFNYGHFRSMPTPINLYLLQRYSDNNTVIYLANPNNPLPKTVAYELGYEQSFIDMFLLRLAGYYKDVSQQPLSITYYNRNGSVTYDTPEPNQYADYRGFEATITKNRGDWIQGFVNYTYSVTSTGRFGFAEYHQNPADQRTYEQSVLTDYQLLTKPIPQPYARANIDLFTPMEFGPKLGGIYLFEDWRINILATWQSGFYFTYVGGGSIPGVSNNMQWRDNYNVDLRISKNFRFGPLNMQLFADVYNALNLKFIDNVAGFTDSKDYDSYMQSLHLPESYFEGFPRDANGKPIPGWSNIGVAGLYVFGNDKPGTFREGAYHAWDQNASNSQKDEWNKNHSYIDMPNQEYFAFLNPRDIYWGLRFSLELF